MMGVRLMLLAVTLTCVLHLIRCEPPLPAHGKYRTSEFVDRSNGYPCYKFPAKRYKLNEGHETGQISGDLVKCGDSRPYKLNVTVFDHQPFVKLHIVSDTLTVDLHRAAPYKGTLYGLVQKCCPQPPPSSAESRAHVAGAEDQDEEHDLSAPAHDTGHGASGDRAR